MNDNFVIDSSGKTPEQLAGLRQVTLVVYVLYALSWVTGITAIIAIVLNYIKREDVQGTLYESHFTWQIRTFWWSLAWSVLGFVTMFVLVGFAILFATAVWCIYRLVKGWLNWSEMKPMPV
ncbi:DUF4870 family protein [Variovorax sp. VNK109]|jgi:uncharacterized membrane protein|uniref:DUF4870 family protein n=1 Tax=Variovorax sp. VNK109 TaxID=3400919 RepID=UPI003C0CAEE8